MDLNGFLYTQERSVTDSAVPARSIQLHDIFSGLPKAKGNMTKREFLDLGNEALLALSKLIRLTASILRRVHLRDSTIRMYFKRMHERRTTFTASLFATMSSLLISSD